MITPEAFAENICETLKRKEINTVAFNIDHLVQGECAMSSSDGSNFIAQCSQYHHDTPVNNALKGYMNSLLKKCKESKMNIIINFNVTEKKNSKIYNAFAAKTTGPFDEIRAMVYTKYHGFLYYTYSDILDGLVSSYIENNCAIIYVVRFEDDDKLSDIYINNVYKQALYSAKNKFNVFDTEICHIHFGQSDKAFANNIELIASSS